MSGENASSGASRTSREELAERGRSARARLPRSTLGAWAPGSGRRAAEEILSDQERSRVPELVPVRHERMAASAFAFFRGAAAVFASDLASTEHSGLIVQLCGDAHLANFGAFASPERTLVFDINDFDETLPGPFEWDLKRLAASFEIAARSNGFGDSERSALQADLTRGYCTAMANYAASGYLQVWYSRLTVDDILASYGANASKAGIKRFQKNVRKAQSKNNLKAFAKLTTSSPDGEPRFLSDPPRLERVAELFDQAEHHELVELIRHAMPAYHRSLQPNRRQLLERYRLVDVARKVVGVGSVGTRCWVALLVGLDASDPLFLQVKEAEASVLEPHLGSSRYSKHGRRVVEGQRLMQSSSDIFLGWERLDGVDGETHDYYFRQLWDWKASADIESMDPELMGIYAQICGQTLARSHARTGDPAAISAYAGGGTKMGQAMEQFAAAYADQNERDHAQSAQRTGVGSAATA